MSVVSEKGLRNVVRQSILKEVQAFKKTVDLQSNRNNAPLECNLKNLKTNKKFMMWFAKHFVFNPVVTINDRGRIRGVNKGSILSVMTGFDLTPEEEAKYEALVSTALQKPGAVDHWINAFEFMLDEIFYPIGIFYCDMINLAFDSSYTREDASLSDGNSNQIKSDFESALLEAGSQFKRINNIQSHRILRSFQDLILFPKTLTEYIQTPGSPAARSFFDQENQNLQDIISQSATPERIYQSLESHLGRVVGYRDIMRPLQEFVSDPQIKNNVDAGDIMRMHLEELRIAIYPEINTAII